jgi:3-methyladenine DNA glycosylase/8-oxoguanine DNA glycosylase
MKYGILNGLIVIEDLSEFDPKQIVESGQLFRYEKTPEGYIIFSKNLKCSLIYREGRVIMSTNNAAYFVDFFDLDRDYSGIKKSLSNHPYLKEAVAYGGGIRILSQDPAEMIFSFIISAYNNIPRIKKIIERLCNALGEDMGGYRAFPSAEAFAKADVSFYRKAGLGLRAERFKRAAETIASGFSLDLSEMETDEARKYLMRLPGVGRKVADCALLFGYRRTDAFPTDVWIERVYNKLFGENTLTTKKKAEKLRETFGNLSGYAQQYLFYYIRETSGRKTSRENKKIVEEIK